MHKSIVTKSAAAFVAMLFAGSTACVKPSPRSIIKTGLDIAQISCVIINEHVDDEHVLAKTCNISEDYLDIIRDLVLGRNKAKAMKAAAAASASASASVAPPAPSASTKK